MEEEKLHLTVVTQKRRPRQAGATEAGAGSARGQRSGEQHSAQRSAEQHSAHHSAEHHSHRHYNDYGTTNLGRLDGSAPVQSEPAAPDVPSQGAIQREFYNKYDQVLSRRYSSRSHGKTGKVLLIALVLVVMLLGLMIGLSQLRDQTGETLAKPEVDTVPVVSLDLGRQ